MLGRRHEIAHLQSDFFREKFRKILRWLLVSVFIMFVLICITIYLILFPAPIFYYGNTSDGIILNMPQPK